MWMATISQKFFQKPCFGNTNKMCLFQEIFDWSIKLKTFTNEVRKLDKYSKYKFISRIFTTSLCNLCKDFSKNTDYSSNPHTVSKQNEMKPKLTRNIKTNPEKWWGTHRTDVTAQMKQAATCDSTDLEVHISQSPPPHGNIWDSQVNCSEIVWKFSCFRWLLWERESDGPEFILGTVLSMQTMRALLTGFQVLLVTMHWCNCLFPDYRNREKNVNLSEDSRSHYLIHRAHEEDRQLHSPFTNIKTANKWCSSSIHFTWREKTRCQFLVNTVSLDFEF
jgi:hypothetical protein